MGAHRERFRAALDGGRKIGHGSLERIALAIAPLPPCRVHVHRIVVNDPDPFLVATFDTTAGRITVHNFDKTVPDNAWPTWVTGLRRLLSVTFPDFQEDTTQ